MLPFLAGLAPFLPLIGTGIQMIGSLFQPKPEPTVVTHTNEIDFVKMRKNAEAAGINPVAALRAGAASGFGSTTTTQSAQPVNPFADMLQIAGAGIANWNYNPVSDARQAVELSIAKKTLAMINSGQKAMPRFGTDIPKYTGRNSTSVADGSPGTMSLPWWDGDFAIGNDTPAQDVADQYGEFIGDTAGFVQYLQDAWANSSDGSTYGARSVFGDRSFMTGFKTGGSF